MANDRSARDGHATATPDDWTQSPVRVLTGLTIILLVACALSLSLADRLPQATTSATADLAERRIDLNSASVEELQLLPGIGPALAARIVEDRDLNGQFHTIEALTRVRGVGPRTVINISGYAAAEAAPDHPDAPLSSGDMSD